MDTARWKKDGDEFAVLDLFALLQFKSGSSLSFHLCTKSDASQLPAMLGPVVQRITQVFTVIGWLDVHHLCDGLYPLHLRVGLPDRYVCPESLEKLIPQVRAALGLPADELYQVELFGLSRQITMDGLLPRLLSTRGDAHP